MCQGCVDEGCRSFFWHLGDRRFGSARLKRGTHQFFVSCLGFVSDFGYFAFLMVFLFVLVDHDLRRLLFVLPANVSPTLVTRSAALSPCHSPSPPSLPPPTCVCVLCFLISCVLCLVLSLVLPVCVCLCASCLLVCLMYVCVCS